jgi:hypothetical protein
MRLLLIACFLSSSSFAIAETCKGILYSDSRPYDVRHCKKMNSGNYCCNEGGQVGEYSGSAYHYPVPQNRHYPKDPTPPLCHDQTYCNPYDQSGNGCKVYTICD